MSGYYEIHIPYCYVWLTENSTSRGELFKRYVLGYLSKAHPDMELIKINGLIAVCMKRGEKSASLL